MITTRATRTDAVKAKEKMSDYEKRNCKQNKDEKKVMAALMELDY